MEPRKKRALDIENLFAFDSPGKFARHVLRERDVLTNALPADLKSELYRDTRVPLRELDCDLLGSEERAAQVVARSVGGDLSEDHADAALELILLPLAGAHLPAVTLRLMRRQHPLFNVRFVRGLPRFRGGVRSLFALRAHPTRRPRARPMPSRRNTSPPAVARWLFFVANPCLGTGVISAFGSPNLWRSCSGRRPTF